MQVLRHEAKLTVYIWMFLLTLVLWDGHSVGCHFSVFLKCTVMCSGEGSSVLRNWTFCPNVAKCKGAQSRSDVPGVERAYVESSKVFRYRVCRIHGVSTENCAYIHGRAHFQAIFLLSLLMKIPWGRLGIDVIERFI